MTGRTAYTHDGGILWEASAVLPDGIPAVADFNDDGLPEVVVSSRGSVRIHNGLNGAVIWSVDFPSGAGRLGAPTVADFDGDPRSPRSGSPARTSTWRSQTSTWPESRRRLPDAKLWSATTKDSSSNMTGSSVFDFEGDGDAEVVYNDEEFLRVYDGKTGQVLFEQPNTSFTALEYPIIVDVDNDGEAEIVVGTNDFECGDQLSCTKGLLRGARLRRRDERVGGHAARLEPAQLPHRQRHRARRDPGPRSRRAGSTTTPTGSTR